MLAAGDDDLDQQLVRLQRRLVEAGDQLLDRHLPLSAHAPGHDRVRAERDEHRRRVGRVVGVGQHAADGRLVPHARARDDRERVRQRGPALAHDRGELDRAVRRQRADAEIPVRADVVQSGNTLQAEKCLRRHQPAVDEDADEGPARDHGRPFAPLGAQRERLVERGRDEPLRLGRQPPGLLVQRLRELPRARDADPLEHPASCAFDRSRLHRPLVNQRTMTGAFTSRNESESAAWTRSSSSVPPISWATISRRTSCTSPSAAPSLAQPVADDRAERSECSRRYSMSSSGAPLRSSTGPPGKWRSMSCVSAASLSASDASGLELEQPVARADEVLRVPVRLDPHERAVLQRQSVVTGRDWSRYSCPSAIAHSTSCGPPKRSSSERPSSASTAAPRAAGRRRSRAARA